MSAADDVRVGGVGLWLPGYTDLDAWLAGTRSEAGERPRGEGLRRIDRRRASPLGRALADVSAEAMQAAGVDPAEVAIVVGSAVAEGTTLLAILDQIWLRREPVSPAAFTMSVHNAAAGLISISHGNRNFATSLAADSDTPAAALFEGLALARSHGRPVLVACGDEASLENLVHDDRRWDALAAAVVLLPPGSAHPVANTDDSSAARPAAAPVLELALSGTPELPPATLDERWARNPQAGLVLAVARGARGTLALDRGSGRGHVARLTDGAAT